MGYGAYSLQNPIKLRMPLLHSITVGLRGMSFGVKRETAQTIG